MYKLHDSTDPNKNLPQNATNPPHDHYSSNSSYQSHLNAKNTFITPNNSKYSPSSPTPRLHINTSTNNIIDPASNFASQPSNSSSSSSSLSPGSPASKYPQSNLVALSTHSHSRPGSSKLHSSSSGLPQNGPRRQNYSPASLSPYPDQRIHHLKNHRHYSPETSLLPQNNLKYPLHPQAKSSSHRPQDYPRSSRSNHPPTDKHKNHHRYNNQPPQSRPNQMLQLNPSFLPSHQARPKNLPNLPRAPSPHQNTRERSRPNHYSPRHYARNDLLHHSPNQPASIAPSSEPTQRKASGSSLRSSEKYFEPRNELENTSGTPSPIRSGSNTPNEESSMSQESSGAQTSKSPNDSLSNISTTNSNETGNSSKGKSSTFYESAVQDIEQEKKMVAALKRLSIGHMMSYDPDLAMDDIEMHLKKEFDEPSPHVLANYKSPEPQEEEFYDAESNDKIFDTSNSLLWVPAELHPEVDPEQFKIHIKSKVDEISERLSSSQIHTPSRKSSLRYANNGTDLQDEEAEEIKRSPSEKTNDQLSNSSKSPSPQKTKRESITSNRFSNPSLRELTCELEKLSKMAGMDATDAVTLARTLSTSSLGYTDIEKLAFDELTTSAKRLSLNSIDDIDSFSGDMTDETISPSGEAQVEASTPISTTLHLQKHLQQQFQLSQLLREKEIAERELLEQEQQEHMSHEQYESRLEREKRLKEAQQQELEQLEQKKREKETLRDIQGNNEFSSKEMSQLQIHKEFALKRSRRPNYRKHPQTSAGLHLQDSKQSKLTNLRSTITSGLGDINLQSNSVLNENAKLHKQRNTRDSQMLFRYRRPDQDKQNNENFQQNYLQGAKSTSNTNLNVLEGLPDSLNPELKVKDKPRYHHRSHQRQKELISESPNLDVASYKSQQLNQNLLLLRSEINEFKESLTKTDRAGTEKNLNRPIGNLLSREASPVPSEGNESDFSFELSYQDVSYDDPLGMDQDILLELNEDHKLQGILNPPLVLEEQVLPEPDLGQLDQLTSPVTQTEHTSTQLEKAQAKELPIPVVQNDKTNEFGQEQSSLTADEVPIFEIKGHRSDLPSESPHVDEVEEPTISPEHFASNKLEPEINLEHINEVPSSNLDIETDNERDTSAQSEVDSKGQVPDDPEPFAPKRLGKKKSFALLGGYSLTSEQSEQHKESSKKLKKKKSWGWLRDRSSSLSSVDSSNLPPIPDNVSIPARSVSNPELQNENDRKAMETNRSRSTSESVSILQKENMITKLFKKKRPLQSSNVSSHTLEARDSSSISDNDLEVDLKKKKLSTKLFKKKSKAKAAEAEVSKKPDTLDTVPFAGKSEGSTLKDVQVDNEQVEVQQQHQQEYQQQRNQEVPPISTISGKENEIPKDVQHHPTKNDNEQSATSKKIAALKKKLKSKEQDVEENTQEIEQDVDTEEREEEKPIHSTQEVQERLKKSIRRTSKANQPIEFTDSAFGFPLPPPSQSTLVMLDYRFPVHVERAIYRLSHLKLANPKRSLREQVLLSNFMYAYLNLVDHTLHLEQQMNEIQDAQEEQIFADNMNETNGEDITEGTPLDLDLEMNV